MILQRLEIPEADVSYLPRVQLPQPDTALLSHLIERVPWREEQVVLWGKRYAQPRLTAWFGDEGCSYTYSGIRLEPLPWTDVLLELKQEVETIADAPFNSVLLNYYRNERDSMGLHSDDEPELGRNPVIASLSLGAERTFVMKHKRLKDVPRVRLPLASGSLLLMKGETQHNWRHGLDKETHPCGARINLTFRRIVV
jgi:alkylated DNA repair dioxygenase AlkB